MIKEKENIRWGTHIEFAVLFVTILGGFYMIDAKCERAHERIDRTYDMFTELSKDMNQKFIEISKEMNQKFYDLLKEGKK